MGHTNEEKFLAAYDAYADALFRHCYFRVYERELAKDLVQETFCRTWTYLASGKDVHDIRAFLYRILHNVIVDEIRKKKTISLEELLEDEGFVPEDTHAKGAEHELMAKDILGTLSSLDAPYRDVVQLRYIDGFSPKEIGSILGVSENVISVRLHRSIKKLREFIAKNGL